MRFFSSRRRDDERGAVLILGALFAGVAVTAAALSIDIGSLVLRKRENQRVADLASLDAVRGLEAPSGQRAAVESLALESAATNGFVVTSTRDCLLPTDPEYPGAVRYASADGASWLLVEVGKWTSATATFAPVNCIPGPAILDVGVLGVGNADAVRVTASSPVSFDFMPGGGRETADALAVLGTQTVTTPPVTTLPTTTGTITTTWLGEAGVMIGSTMASIDTTKSQILNGIFEEALDPAGLTTPTIGVSAVGYEGLANTYVSVEDLATALGISAGTVDQVMNAQFTVEELFAATADALNQNGESTVTVTVLEMSDAIPPASQDVPSQTISLSDLESYGTSGTATMFDGSSIASSYLTVLDVLRSGAVIADGDHLIATPFPTSLTPAGVTTATLELTVIEAEQSGYGGVGAKAETAQIRTTIHLTVPVSIPDVGVVTVTVPVTVEGGGATATITGFGCPAPTTVPDVPAPPPATTQTASSVDVLGEARTLEASTGAFVTSALGGLITISGDPVAAVASAGSAGTTYQFLPAFTDTFTVQAAQLESLGVPAGSIDVTIAGVPPVGVTPASIASDVASALNPVLSALPPVVMPNLYDALGIAYGSADIRLMTGATPPHPACVPTDASASTPTGGGSTPGGTTVTYSGIPTLVD